MTLHFDAVAFDAEDPAALASFWGSLLGREPVPERDGSLLPCDETQVGLRFVEGNPDRSPSIRNLHLHVTTSSPEDREQTIADALRLGGRHLHVGQLPEEDHTVLADPGGNAFCVIEPGNGYLAGCGRLGEIACDGTRDVGLFWHEALRWPLVWDQDEETAIQSPAGGTKVAWGGPPLAPKGTRISQRFHLTTDDPDAEIARLITLGATRLRDLDGGVELADPDGNEFWIACPQ
ncbi:VOC family protein [Nocardioides pacificus]